MAELFPNKWLRALLDPHGTGELPRAPGLPLLGSLPAVMVQQFDFFENARERCGPLFEVDFGVTTVVMIADPELAAVVMLDRPKHFDKGEEFWNAARETIGNGLPISEGQLWRRQRRLMNPEFRRAKIAGFRQIIEATVDELLAELDGPAKRGETLDISDWTSKLLSTLTVRILLGVAVDLERMARFRDALITFLDQLLSGIVFRKLPSWVPAPGAKELAAAKQVINGTILDVINERRANPRESNDLLGMLMSATDEDGAMSDKQLRDEVVAVYIAGYETTAWSLAWTLWLLADHPAVVEELQAELDQVSDVMESPLLRATITEAMRLYPSVPFLPRRAAVDETLAGHPIPAGTTVVLSPWLIHRNPDVWPDPLRFDPHRHLGEQPARPRLALMPFGAGQRICIGQGLAKLEATIALGALLQRFTPKPGAGPRSRPRMSTTLRSRDGIRVRLEART